MAIDEKQKHQLKKLVKELSSYKARHTELITVYVPSGYDINKINTHLSEEYGTASNIKSASTRKNVQGALTKMLERLKLIPQTPPNGLALFSGNVSEREGKEDFQVWDIEPPAPINQRIYRCDKAFFMEPLGEFLETDEVYGLVVMDKREGTIGLLKGKAIIVLDKASSNVPGKTRAGGQSSVRFARLREGAAIDFYKKIAEMMKNNFLKMVEEKKLKGILVGGPGHTKNDFIDKNYITDQVAQKILTIKDIAYTDESGLHDLVEKSEDVLAEEEVAGEKKIVQKFLNMLATDRKKVTYGMDYVRKALEMGAVETLMISEVIDDDTTEELEDLAKQFGSNVKIISTDTREGVQLKDLGKIAAILRYEVEY